MRKFYALITTSTLLSVILASGWLGFFPLSVNADDPPLPRDAGGVRGGTCLIAPVGNTDQLGLVWSDRPFLIWKNYERGLPLQAVELREAGSEEILFRATVAGEETVAYVGAPLQRGVTYEWLAYASLPWPRIQQFQVADSATHNQIAAELEQLEAEELSTEADPTLRQIIFFAERELWSDALRVTFTAAHPSEAVIRYQEAIYDHACANPST